MNADEKKEIEVIERCLLIVLKQFGVFDKRIDVIEQRLDDLVDALKRRFKNKLPPEEVDDIMLY